MEKNERVLSRRRFVAHALAGLGATLLAACAPRTVEVEKEVTRVVEKEVERTVVVEKEVEKVVTPTPAPAGQKRIVYYDRTTSAPQWAEAYNETQDDTRVEVEIQPPGQRYEQLIAAIMAGNAPDVIGLDCVQVGRFAQLGAVAPLEDLLPQDVLGLYFQNLVTRPGHYGVYQGHLLGVPFWVDMSILYYNKTFYEEAGGDPDNAFRSWEDYVVYGKGATVEDRFGFAMLTGGGSDFLYQPWIWAQGGDFVNADWTASTAADDPSVANMLQFMRDLIHVHKITNDAVATDWTAASNLFTNQKAMSHHLGGGGVGLIRREFPELWEVLGVTLIPGPEAGQASSFIGGNVASITTQSREKEAALDFLIWATARDEGQTVTGEVGYLCGTPSGMDLPVFTKDAHIYSAFKKGLDTGYPASNDPRFDEVRSPYLDAVAAAQLGERPIAQIVEQMDNDINRILQR
jgi:ABC-type glycerol-3-phosphate transport system substrate-binding protein